METVVQGRPDQYRDLVFQDHERQRGFDPPQAGLDRHSHSAATRVAEHRQDNPVPEELHREGGQGIQRVDE